MSFIAQYPELVSNTLKCFAHVHFGVAPSSVANGNDDGSVKVPLVKADLYLYCVWLLDYHKCITHSDGSLTFAVIAVFSTCCSSFCRWLHKATGTLLLHRCCSRVHVDDAFLWK